MVTYYVSESVYQELSKFDVKERMLLLDVVFRMPSLEYPRGFTTQRIHEVLDCGAHISPKDAAKRLKDELGVKLTLKKNEKGGYTQTVGVEFGPQDDLVRKILSDSTMLADRYDARTGNRYRKKTLVSEAESRHDARITELLANLNEPKNIYARSEKHVDFLKEMASSMFLEGNLKKHALDCQLAELDSMRQYPQPCYKDVQRTVRIYPDGWSYLGFARGIRYKLFDLMGWINIDLKAAHLAIVAWLWKLPLIEDFLREGKSVWNYLAEEMGWMDKDLFKGSIYGIVYGSSVKRETKKGIIKDWKEAGRKDDLAKFLKIPIIAELVAGRDKRLKQITKDTYITNAFGQKVSLDCRSKVDNRSLLSHEAQSWEMLMMLDVFDVVKKYDRVYVAAWLHDGMAIQSSLGKERVMGMLKKAEKALDKYRKMGILTSLEVTGIE